MKIQHEGAEIEVFTSEEMEAQITANSEAVKTQVSTEFTVKYKDYDDFKTKSGELETKLAETEDLLKSAENDPAKKAQIERLRGERDDAKAAAEILSNAVGTQIDELRSEFMGDYKGELLGQVAGTDEDLKKKISLEFDRYRPTDNKREDVKVRMERAYVLATGQAPAPGLFDGGVMSGGAGAGEKPKDTTSQTPESAIALGKRMNISEEDRKRFSPTNDK